MPCGASFDFVVVGAGIVGLTVAGEILRRRPRDRVAVLEKEAAPALHASGRNSGVLHCGIYYASDTVKARVCAAGARRMLEFARAEGIAHAQHGKVILATALEQLPTVDRLLDNARANGIAAERIDERRLRELEPHAASGPAAIWCPTTAVIDSAAVVARLRERLTERGAEFIFQCQALAPLGPGALQTSRGTIGYGLLLNCAGAHADRLAKAYGLARDYALVPFKGIYWKLADAAKHLVRANIYPVPDVSLPFLGVHCTRVVSGEVYVGPTAIPALGRENYGLLQGLNLAESLGIGLQLAGMYLRNENHFRRLAHAELGKYRKRNFLAAARRLVPELRDQDLVPTAKAGIRPQLVNTRTRQLEMDYLLERTEDSLHVLNAISPAFTSGFAFAEWIVNAAGVS
jgi:(S)-2-hydroxyglutarate dehydrogenase